FVDRLPRRQGIGWSIAWGSMAFSVWGCVCGSSKISHTDGNPQVVTVAADGSSTYSASLSHDFGSLLTQTSAAFQATIENIGRTPVSLVDVRYDDGFDTSFSIDFAAQ